MTHLKLALDILSLLCKSKSNAARLISLGEILYASFFLPDIFTWPWDAEVYMLAFLASSFSYGRVSNGDRFLGGVALLIGLYNDWHRFDSANRHINIRKSVLGVLKQITNLKSGNSIDRCFLR